jgi:L-ascorbate metabolism protein UlaG (beta-lactamase superfamily)
LEPKIIISNNNLMELIWHGYSCFTMKTKHGTTVIDPYNPKTTGLKLPALKADLVLVSHNHEGHNNTDAVAGAPKIIDWPGEYEVKGIAISAIQIPYKCEGTEENPGKGLIFALEVDNLRICFMGDIGNELDAALIESIGDVDVLMLPIGGHNTLDAKGAHLLIEEIEPRVVIPMHYGDGSKNNLDGLEPFLKQAGCNTEPRDKYVVNSRSELSQDKMEVVLLNEQTA